jgi:hypothetical protein
MNSNSSLSDIKVAIARVQQIALFDAELTPRRAADLKLAVASMEYSLALMEAAYRKS